MNIVVTRHLSALEWIQEKGIEIHRWIQHVSQEDIEKIQEGDTIFGVLPLNIINNLNKKGVRTILLIGEVPPALRGGPVNLKPYKV